MVHSQKNIIVPITKSQNQKKNTTVSDLKSLFKSNKRLCTNLNVIEHQISEDEETFYREVQNNHFNQNLGCQNNDESILKFSPNQTSKRNSMANYKRLDISNILKNQGSDTIIDEEDNLILGRLIQKYQREFNSLQSNPDTARKNSGKIKRSHYSQSTLNLNSHDTQTVQINSSKTINQSNLHKKLQSMLQLDKSSLFNTQNEQNQNNQSNQIKLQQEILQALINQQSATPSQVGKNEKHIMIDEEDDEYLNEKDLNNVQNQEKENSLEGRLSFTSPSSIKMQNMKGRRVKSHIFNDQKDHSISVSKIEQIDENEEGQDYTATKFDFNTNQNKDEDGNERTNCKKDFSFSIEKSKDQIYYFSSSNNREQKHRKFKKKDGASRNQYTNQINLSKEERENVAMIELQNVLNQQYQLAQNIQMRSTDLVAGGTYGGVIAQNGAFMMYNPSLEQETANFNIGDWQHARSPMGSTHQNFHRPLTRSSIIGRSSQRSNKNHLSRTSQTIKDQLMMSNHPDQNNFIYMDCQRKLQMVTSPDRYSGNFHHQSNQQSVSRFNGYQDGQYSNMDPIETISKLNFNYQDMENQECQSPIMIQSHFANFSQDFVSPERANRSNINGMTTQRKDNPTNNQILNNSVLLNTSGATTFAQQSAFEQFRSKLNENLRNIQPQQPPVLSQQNHFRQLSLAQRAIKPLSMAVSPNPKAKQHIQSKFSEEQMLSRAYQSNQVSNKKPSIQRFDHNPVINQSPQRWERQEQICLQFNPIRQDTIQRQSALGFDMAEPMEMGSTFNSIQNFNLQKQSTHQLISIKENLNPRASIKELTELDTFDDHEMTLKQSPDRSCSNQIKQSQNFQAHHIPILQFDISSKNLTHEQSIGNLRQSKAQIQQDQFFSQTIETLDNNHFSKRTMSHNDLVMLGTMSQQQTLQGCLTQRSQSIAQFDQFGQTMSQQNKYIDAFKQYEAEKKGRKRSGDNQQWKISNCNQTLNFFDSSRNVESLNQQDTEGLSQRNTHQNFFQPYNTQQNQVVYNKHSFFDPILEKQTQYVIEEQQNQMLKDHSQHQLQIMHHENDTSQNILQNGIQETEAEQEESFIIADHSRHIKKQKFQNLQYSTVNTNTHLNDNGGTLSTILNQNNTNEILDDTKYSSNHIMNNVGGSQRQKSFGSLSRKPKEVVIQLDISSYATNKTHDQKIMNQTMSHHHFDKSSQSILVTDIHGQDQIHNYTSNRETFKPTTKTLQNKILNEKSKSQTRNSNENNQRTTKSKDAKAQKIMSHINDKSNLKSRVQKQGGKNLSINLKNQTQQLLVNELMKQQNQKNHKVKAVQSRGLQNMSNNTLELPQNVLTSASGNSNSQSSIFEKTLQLKKSKQAQNTTISVASVGNQSLISGITSQGQNKQKSRTRAKNIL
eukprot:403343337